MTHEFEYDGERWEAELDVTPGSPGIAPTMGEPGEPPYDPTLDLKKLRRFDGREWRQVGAEARNLWRDIETFLNEDAAHIVGQASDAARAAEGEARYDSQKEDGHGH